MPFPHYTQLDAMDCGPTCLRMVARHHGKHYNLETLRERSYITREGVSMLGISRAAESIGFRTMGVKLSFEQLRDEAPLPAIVHWNQLHFVVVYKISGKKGREIVHVADPAGGLLKFPRTEFIKCWVSTIESKTEDDSEHSAKTNEILSRVNQSDKEVRISPDDLASIFSAPSIKGEERGIALLLEPTPEFYSSRDEKPNRRSFGFLFSYLRPYHKMVVQLFLGLILGSLLQLLFPFLTQSIVDQGIGNRNISFIYLVLIAQMVLTLSRVSVEFIRGWILLHLGTRINVSLISDFLTKLMRLPMRYFDTKMTGDLMQRIGDHSRIENFLTGTSLNVVFSLINLLIFGAVLLFYSVQIFAVFFIGSALYAIWVWLFLKKRAELDHRRFAQMSANQSNLIQLIQGMQEIKISGCEQQKRWEWESIQARLFRVGVKGLALSQYQQSGALLVNEFKNIIITVIAATSVVDGNLTLGMMMAIQYIIGQLNSPIDQLISFINVTQDAKISLERLAEVHLRDDEEDMESSRITDIPSDAGLSIQNLSFRYEGPDSELVLNDVNLTIPEGKQTAIVGTSGSGKTTLVKLMLGFYPLAKGEIRLGSNNLDAYSLRTWREECGVVMQDGFIFSDTIARNIAPGVEIINKSKLINAAFIANIDSFISTLPLGYNTKIGSEGHGLSQGQKQRILIARAVYKDPKFIFLDEATNSLDANNERAILDNLQEFIKGRTSIVVAHRLSTVKNADQIVVIEKGRIVEVGTHKELSQKKGAYYTLVKNQLEL
ncbi:MAG: peptidase domain-containing ABC transporter [Tenuifilaceae bacterium]|nr:peptidase domain-containing ABC transporter [Tenuifilaceae bacterium]